MTTAIEALLVSIVALPFLIWSYIKVRKDKRQDNFETFKREKFIEFILRNEDRVKEWNRHHRPEEAPIFWDPKALDWVWLNRQQQKQLKKMRNA